MIDDQAVVNTFSYIWRHDAPACIEHLVARGHRRFEILLTAPHLWPSDCGTAARARLAARTRALGAEIVSLNAGGFDNNLASPAADVRAFALEYLRAVVDLAADLGTPYVVMSPGVGRPLKLPPREWLLGWFHAGMDVLVRHARTRGVRLLIENIPFAILPKAADLMAALEPYPADEVAVVYDTANATFAREDPAEGIATVASRLRLVHLCDTPLDAWRHDPLGTGAVPFADVAVALSRQGGDVPRVFEIVSDDPDRDIDESVDLWRRLVGRAASH